MTLRSHTNVEKPELNVDIELTEPVSLTFSLKYLVNFCKAAALSTQVKICLSSEVPLLVEYNLSGSSYLRFYLAPKVRPDPVGKARAWLLPLTLSLTDWRRRVRLRMRNRQRWAVKIHVVAASRVDLEVKRVGRQNMAHSVVTT